MFRRDLFLTIFGLRAIPDKPYAERKISFFIYRIRKIHSGDKELNRHIIANKRFVLDKITHFTDNTSSMEQLEICFPEYSAMLHYTTPWLQKAKIGNLVTDKELENTKDWVIV